LAGGEKALLEIMMSTHAGWNVVDMEADWKVINPFEK
jgi:hypothetical protein